MTNFRIHKGAYNVHYLSAPYSLLVKAFGNDGINPRDDYKQMCQWDITAPNNTHAEVYDYKVGKCYDPYAGLERKQITDWHVQGDDDAIRYLVTLLDRADNS